MGLGYQYYRHVETGWDPSMPSTCPMCGTKCYSSSFLNRHSGGSAKCPSCGFLF